MSTDNILESEALDRLRTIVDENIGMQPVLGWEELLTLVETQLRTDHRRKWNLAEALNDVFQATLPEKTIGPFGIERICQKREVYDALSSPADCGRAAPTGGADHGK